AFELPVCMMWCPGNCMAHLAAALPNHMMMEVIADGQGACFTVDSRIEDGWILLGDSPGLGIVFDEEKLNKLLVRTLSPGSDLSLWGRRREAGLYEIAPSEPISLD
ncbi:unnamed protein product, partial [marine sediment metagenome]